MNARVPMEPPPFIVPDSIEHRLRLALERVRWPG